MNIILRSTLLLILTNIALLVPVIGDESLMTEKQVNAQITKATEAAEGEDGDGQPNESIAIWKEVKEILKKRAAAVADKEKFEVQLKSAKEKLDELANPTPEKLDTPDATMTLEQLQQTYAKLKSVAESSGKEIQQLTKQIGERNKRKSVLSEQIGTFEGLLGSHVLKSEPGKNASGLENALYQESLSKKKWYEAKLSALATEKKANVIAGDYDIKQLRRIEARAAEVEQVISKWEKALNEKKAQVDQESISKDKDIKDTFEGISGLEELARNNVDLAKELAGDNSLSQQKKDAEQQNVRLQDELDKLLENKKYASNRIKLLDKAGLQIDQQTGAILRRQRSSLPSVQEIKSQLKQEVKRSADVELHLLELENKLADMPMNTEAFILDVINNNEKSVDKDAARALIQRRSELLRQLIREHRELLEVNNKTINLLQAKIDETKKYSLFLDQRLLWIASAPPYKLDDVVLELNAISSIVNDGYLVSWWNDLYQDALENKIVWIIFFVLWIVLLLRRSLLIRISDANNTAGARRNCTSILPTVYSFLAELALALIIPALFFFIFWRTDTGAFLHQALLMAGVFIFLVGLLKSLSRKDGFLVSHFKLRTESMSCMNGTLRWFMPLMLAVLILTASLLGMKSAEPLGRTSFIIGGLILLMAMVRLFKPSHKLMSSEPKGNKLQHIVFYIVVIFPVVLIIAAAMGYFASALTLRSQFVASLWLIALTLFVAAFVSRWFLVARRKVSIQQAMRYREALIAEREEEERKKAEAQESAPDEDNSNTKETAQKEATPSVEAVKAEAVDIAEVKDQTRKLIRVAVVCSLFFGLIGIWSQSLTALSVLDGVQLWETTSSTSANVDVPSNPVADIAGGSENAEKTDGETSSSTEWITLQDLLVSMLTLLLTFMAARNVPALLGVVVLGNLNMSSGGVYALKTAIRYLIVLVGVILAFNNIGITWSKIQWIAAAVTLGIGFGLQEVFANFVAGLILLFEQPIRLGDTVTIGEVSGRVTKIKIRATTILQFNNRELIVPNKEFITGQLINWTHNDNVLRIDIPVGVAYGSDTEKVKTLLLQVAKENKKVLDTPESDVIFENFGASSLDFKLRGYVAGVEDLIRTRSDLHYAVDQAFREADIEISFPQQDVHIRTIDATGLSAIVKNEAKS